MTFPGKRCLNVQGLTHSAGGTAGTQASTRATTSSRKRFPEDPGREIVNLIRLSCHEQPDRGGVHDRDLLRPGGIAVDQTSTIYFSGGLDRGTALRLLPSPMPATTPAL